MGFRGETVALGLLSLFWNGFLVVWTFGAATGGAGFFALLSIPFWLIGAGLVVGVVNYILKRVHLHIGPHQFVLEQSLLGRTRRLEGKTIDLSGAELQTAYTSNNRPIRVITLIEGVHNHKWGTPSARPKKHGWWPKLTTSCTSSRLGSGLCSVPRPPLPKIASEV